MLDCTSPQDSNSTDLRESPEDQSNGDSLLSAVTQIRNFLPTFQNTLDKLLKEKKQIGKDSHSKNSPKACSNQSVSHTSKGKSKKKQIVEKIDDKKKHREIEAIQCELIKLLYDDIDIEKTEEQLDHLVKLKEKLVLLQARNISDSLKPFLSSVVINRSQDLLFLLENMRSVTVNNSLCDKFEAFSGVDSKSGKLMMAYGTLPGGTLIPVKHFRSSVFKMIYTTVIYYIKNSEYGLFHPTELTGLWRHILITINEVGEAMVVLTGNLSESVTEENVLKSASHLKEYFENEPLSTCNVVSLVLRLNNDRDESLINLIGEKYLTYELKNIKVKIFASSLPWPNLCSVEAWTVTVLELTNATKSLEVLQFGCGYVVVSLYLAQWSKKMLLVDKQREQSESIAATVREIGDKIKYLPHQLMMKDFKNNMKKYLGISENICVLINENYSTEDGLDEKTLCDLCDISAIKKIIWIGDFTKDFMIKKLLTLCVRKPNSKNPFIIKTVIPVDMSPYENNVNTIYFLVRESDACDEIERNISCNETEDTEDGDMSEKFRKFEDILISVLQTKSSETRQMSDQEQHSGEVDVQPRNQQSSRSLHRPASSDIVTACATTQVKTVDDDYLSSTGRRVDPRIASHHNSHGSPAPTKSDSPMKRDSTSVQYLNKFTDSKDSGTHPCATFSMPSRKDPRLFRRSNEATKRDVSPAPSTSKPAKIDSMVCHDSVERENICDISETINEKMATNSKVKNKIRDPRQRKRKHDNTLEQ